MFRGIIMNIFTRLLLAFLMLSVGTQPVLAETSDVPVKIIAGLGTCLGIGALATHLVLQIKMYRDLNKIERYNFTDHATQDSVHRWDPTVAQQFSTSVTDTRTTTSLNSMHTNRQQYNQSTWEYEQAFKNFCFQNNITKETIITQKQALEKQQQEVIQTALSYPYLAQACDVVGDIGQDSDYETAMKTEKFKKSPWLNNGMEIYNIIVKRTAERLIRRLYTLINWNYTKASYLYWRLGRAIKYNELLWRYAPEKNQTI